MSASLKDRKALIIGGGPVGLSAAYVLKKQCGLNIEVYEGASELVKVRLMQNLEMILLLTQE